jgi:hypothetical protein
VEKRIAVKLATASKICLLLVPPEYSIVLNLLTISGNSRRMAAMPILRLVVTFIHSLFKTRRQLVLENLALRQQVAMLRQSVKRPRATPADKLFWILFFRYVDGWRNTLHALHPDTIVLNERHLGRILREYFTYYHTSGTHLSLNKAPPESRAVESVVSGNIVALPRAGGLHHRYTRIAA